MSDDRVRRSRLAEEDPALAELLFDREIRAAARVTPGANAAHSVGIVVAGFFIIPVDAVISIIWSAIGVLLCMATVLRWILHLKLTARQLFWEIMVSALSFGVLWGLAGFWAISWGTLQQQLLYTGLFAGVIGAGTIAMSTNRTLGITWTCSISLGAFVAFLSNGETVHLQIAVLLFVYDFAMLLGVVHLSDSFRARCLAEYEAEFGRIDLQVLLDDFESGSRDWLWEIGPDGTLSRISDRFSRISSLPAAELRTLSLSQFLERMAADDPVGRAALLEIENHLQQRSLFSEVVVPVVIRGESRWWSLSGKPHAADRWRGLGSDLTEAVVAKERIDRLITTDPVTGLPNRFAFNRELDDRIEDGTGGSIHLGIIDLDHFKTVNDTLGHPSGDILIGEVGSALVDALEDGEFCARFGGDEFAVLLADQLSTAVAQDRFQVIHQSIKKRIYHIDRTAVSVTSSIGFAGSREVGADCTLLISAADMALYAAKGAGRDQVCQWTEELTESANRRTELIRDLERAVADREFVVFFQPQTNLSTGEVVGVEALVRWQHPREGLLGPADFLQLAIESGLIVGIGEIVLTEALSTGTSLPESVSLSVNVSARELLSPTFVTKVVRMVAESGLDPGRLVLEVTEDAVVSAEGRQVLLELRRCGFGLSMDDFGTGYSSFALLAELRFDEIKIDRSLIQPLGEDDTVRILVSTIIDMTVALGARVVAEGVETVQQRELLRSWRCHRFQGYLEARPLPADALRRHLGLEPPVVELPAKAVRIPEQLVRRETHDRHPQGGHSPCR